MSNSLYTLISVFLIAITNLVVYQFKPNFFIENGLGASLACSTGASIVSWIIIMGGAVLLYPYRKKRLNKKRDEIKAEIDDLAQKKDNTQDTQTKEQYKGMIDGLSKSYNETVKKINDLQ